MPQENEISQEQQRNMVREHYSEVARKGGVAACCAPGAGMVSADSSLKLGYSQDDLAAVPDGSNMGLGCGNPHLIASLKPGETVLDLGSGGGFDAFLAQRQVGETGAVIGVDMSPDMLSKARANAVQAGVSNVEFRLGEIEHLPVHSDTVDVIMSNCVINLSPDQEQVYREAFRVLKVGGRLAISDTVALQPLPEHLRAQALAISGCLAGATEVGEIERQLKRAGFKDVRVEVKPESREFIKDWFPGTGAEEYIGSANIIATKKSESDCCAPACCAE